MERINVDVGLLTSDDKIALANMVLEAYRSSWESRNYSMKPETMRIWLYNVKHNITAK